MPSRTIAVIGGGISGLAAGYVLSRSDRVTLFEAAARLGGHADTHLVGLPGAQVPVDTGFIVFNERTYPLLTRLFGELEVSTQESEMSMSISCATAGPATLLSSAMTSWSARMLMSMARRLATVLATPQRASGGRPSPWVRRSRGRLPAIAGDPLTSRLMPDIRDQSDSCRDDIGWEKRKGGPYFDVHLPHSRRWADGRPARPLPTTISRSRPSVIASSPVVTS
jgi:NAD(P)-binding Rossmann-like domain